VRVLGLERQFLDHVESSGLDWFRFYRNWKLIPRNVAFRADHMGAVSILVGMDHFQV